MNEQLAFSLALVVFAGLCAQWLAWRLRLPSILVLLLAGFILGPVSATFDSSGKPWLDPDAVFGQLLFPMVSLAVSVILFEGGLTLRFAEIKGSGIALRNLMSVGVLITWASVAAAAVWLLPLGMGQSLLFGAILTVTGPTVIGPLLRHVKPSGRVASILKWEGIVNDPIGATLSVLVFEVIVHGSGSASAVIGAGIAKTLLLGVGGGLLGAFVLLALLRRYLIPDYLHGAFALASSLMVFAISNHFQHESGLLAVTVMGIALVNQRKVDIAHIIEFKENLGVLFISMLFILLSARLQFDDLAIVEPATFGFLALLILVIRPVAALLSTVRSGLPWQERVFIAWMAPRGVVAAAVASVFALRLANEGHPEAQAMVPLMFVVIIATVAVYGLSAAPFARILGLSHRDPQGVLFIGAHRVARAMARVLRDLDHRVLLIDTNWENTAIARQSDLPAFYGSALSEQAMASLDLGGLGRMLALTSNDEVNSLSSMHFADVFGRRNAYQFAARPGHESRTGTVAHGRALFAPGATFARLDALIERKYEVRALEVAEEASAHDLIEGVADAVPLFVSRIGGRLFVVVAGEPTTCRVGDRLVALVPPDAGPTLTVPRDLESAADEEE